MKAFLRLVIDAATGRSHRSREARHPLHGNSQGHARPARHRPADRIVTLNVGILRLSLAAVAFVVLVWLGWRILSDTIGQNLASSAPAEALAWAPYTSGALNRLAQRELIKSGGDLEAAQEWALRALRSNPLDNQALFVLGTVAEKKGDRTRANDLIRKAGARTWRNMAVQLWLFEQDTIRNNFPEALAHADALFRVDPRFVPIIFPTIAAYSTNPASLAALTDFLQTNPPWRQWVVESLADRLYDKSRLDGIFTTLAQSRAPPTKQEFSAYLRRLIRDQRYDFAYRKWRDSLSPLQAESGIPFNGSFELPVDGAPFNWNFGFTAGATVEIVPAPGAQGNALRVQFSGARIDFSKVKQLLLLQPGSYRLEGRVKADQLRTSRGLWWRVSCTTGSQTTLAQTELVSGNIPWSSFHVDFEVPSQDCKAQELRLELPARIASEREIEGQVWYQALRIRPSSTGLRSGEVNIPSNN